MINEIRKNAGLNEEFRDYVKPPYSKKPYAIYKNPSSSDYSNLKKEEKAVWFRYIVKLYGGKYIIFVFNADLLHNDAAEHLGIPYKMRAHIPIWGDYGFGVSKLIDGKLKLEDGIKKEINKLGLKNFDVEFLKKYFADIE